MFSQIEPLDGYNKCRRRTNNYSILQKKYVWTWEDFWCFSVKFEDMAGQMKVYVDANFFPGYVEGDNLARFYAYMIGKIPKVTREGWDNVYIHTGGFRAHADPPSNSVFLYHSEVMSSYLPTNNVEELMMHEGSHVTIDS